MELLLFKNFAKRKDSTKRPNLEAYDKKCDVNLKVNTSYKSPVFTISDTSYPKYTYAYITDLDRYYFVRTTSQGNRNFYELQLELDPMATAKTAIGNYNCYIERTSDSNYYVSDIHDGAVSNTDVIIDTSQATTETLGFGGVYVCRTISQTNGIGTYFGTINTFKKLFSPDLDGQSLSGTIDELIKFFLFNPSDYVLDIYFLAVPYSDWIEEHTAGASLSAGWYSAVGTVPIWNSSSPLITGEVTLNKPTPHYSDFRGSSEAFTSYDIYLPAVGCVPLPADIMDGTLSLKWAVDVLTGEISYQLFCTKTSKTLIATYSGGIKAPLMTGSMTPSAGSLLKSAGIIAGMASGGATLALTAGAIGATQTALATPPSVHGTQGSVAGVLTNPDVVISMTCRGSGEFPVNQVGRPCCKNLAIGSLSGFVKCGNPSLEMAIESEILDEINAQLAAGFYYE